MFLNLKNKFFLLSTLTLFVLCSNRSLQTVGPEIQANIQKITSKTSPSMTIFAQGSKFIIIWQTSNTLYGSIYFTNGTAIQKELTLIGSTSVSAPEDRSWNSYSISSCDSLDGGFLIAWVGVNQLNSSFCSIWIQKFSEIGEKIGSEILVESILENQEWPQIKTLKSGAFVIVWRSGGYQWDTLSNVLIKIYESDGSVRLNATLCFGNDMSYFYSALAILDNDEIIVVAQYFSANYKYFWVKKYDPYGLVLIDRYLISSFSNYSPYIHIPWLTTLPQGFAIFDSSKVQLSSEEKYIIGCFFSNNIDVIHECQYFGLPPLLQAAETQLILLEDGDYIMSYAYINKSQNSYDIYAKKIDSQDLTILNDNIVIASKQYTQWNHQILPFKDGNFIVTYLDIDYYYNTYGNIIFKIISPGSSSPKFIKNELILTQGETVIITRNNINCSLGIKAEIQVTSLISGKFFKNNENYVLNFTQENVDQSSISFVHDGSQNPPSYFLQCIEGINKTKIKKASIVFQLLPFFIKNDISLLKNSKVLITSAMIKGGPTETLNYYKVLTNISCYFSFSNDFSKSIESFTPSDIEANNLYIVTLEWEINSLPSYELQLYDIYGNSIVSQGNIISKEEIIIRNYNFTISQGETIKIKEDMIWAQANSEGNIFIIVISLQNGYFISPPNYNVPLFFFPQTLITNGELLFIHNGGLNKPKTFLLAINGLQISNLTQMNINFFPNTYLENNFLEINRSESIILNENNFKAISKNELDVNFYVKDLYHGKFKVSTQDVMAFSQENIINSQVLFIHDGSENPPSFSIFISDGENFSDPFPSQIIFEKISYPIPTLNYFEINEGESFYISVNDLKGFDGINNNFVFEVKNLENIKIISISEQNKSIISFTTQNISNMDVMIISEGSATPSFEFKISTLEGLTNNVFYSANIKYNSKPIIMKNCLTISKGEAKTITQNFLQGFDLETAKNNLIIMAFDILNGYFENIANPGVQISIFFQSDVIRKTIKFVHDNTNTAPNYKIVISDGVLKSEISEANVKFHTENGICGLVLRNILSSDFIMDIDFSKDFQQIYATTYQGNFIYYDISDPRKPNETDYFSLIDFNISKVGKFIKKEKIAYLLTESQTLAILSLEDIDMPKIIGIVGEERKSLDFDLCHSDDYIYLAAGSNGIYVINSTDKYNPKFMNSFSLKSYYVASVKCFKDSYLLALTQEIGNNNFNLYILNTTSNLEILAEVQLESNAYSFLLNQEENRLFIGVESGILIVDISNFLSPSVIKTFYFNKPILNIKLCFEENYILAQMKNSIIMVRLLNDNENYLIDKVDFDFDLSQILIFEAENLIYVSSREGLAVIDILFSSRYKLPINMETPGYQETINNNYYAAVSIDSSYYFITNIYKNTQHLFIFDGKNSMQYIIQSIDLKCSEIFSSAIRVSKNNKYLFVLICGNLSVFNINPLNSSFIKVSSIENKGVYDFVISNSEKYVYISNAIDNSIDIIEIQEDKTLVNFSKIYLSGSPKKILCNKNDNLLYVILEENSYLIINISNPLIPKIIHHEINLPIIKSMVYTNDLDGNEFLLITDYTGGFLMIFIVTQPEIPQLVSKIFIDFKMHGIGLSLQQNYVFVQSEEKLTVIGIENKYNPIILNQINCGYIKDCLEVGILNLYAVFPNFLRIKLYKDELFFYPKIYSNTFLGQKNFQIKFYGVDPLTLDKSQENFKILKINSRETFPNWVTFTQEDNILSINPVNPESLMIFEKISLIFCKQISKDSLLKITNNNETIMLLLIQELLVGNYIDANYYPTLKFYLNQQIILQDSLLLDISQINYLFNSQIVSHIFSFTLQEFSDLDEPPYLGEKSLQDQFDEATNNKIRLNEKLDFQFDSLTFIDPDGDLLTFSAFNLPNFLEFDSTNRRIFGTPLKNNLGTYLITILASDQYLNVSQNFVIKISKNSPRVNSQENKMLILGNSFEWLVPNTAFIDEDSDQLALKAYSINPLTKNKTHLPSWLYFNADSWVFYGEPLQIDIEKEQSERRYFEIFRIRVEAWNIADQMSYFDFNITVINNFPILKLNITEQFLSLYPRKIRLAENINFEFSEFTFIDLENNTISYSLKNSPNWLILNGRKITGSANSKYDTGEYNITIIANDGYGTTESILYFTVSNLAPISQKIPNFYFIYGETFNFSLSDSSGNCPYFSDPDGDQLTYSVKLITKNGYKQLPFWIYVDLNTLTFSGNPQNISYFENNQTYNDTFEIMIFSQDPWDSENSSSFTLNFQNGPLVSNKEKTLEKQFENYEIQVDSYSEFIFDSDTFIDPFNQTIIYEAYLKSFVHYSYPYFSSIFDFKKISQNSKQKLPSYISFYPDKRKFSFHPSSNEYADKIEIEVIAKKSIDNLSTSDAFSFQVRISTLYTLKLIGIFLGFIGSLYGFWELRYLIYAMLFKKYYCYKEYEIVEANSLYMKKVYLVKEDMKICQKIWARILKKKFKLTEIYISSHSKNKLKNIIIEVYEELKKEKKFDKNINFSNKKYSFIIYYLLALETLKKYPKAFTVFKSIKSHCSNKKGNQWYDNLIKMKEILMLNNEMTYPLIEVKENELEKVYNSPALKKVIKDYKNYSNIPLIEKRLITDQIISEVLGIQKKKLLKMNFGSSIGETMSVDWTDVDEIKILLTDEKNKYVHSKFYQIPRAKTSSQISSWLKFYVKNNILIFEGTPSTDDIGKIVIQIFKKKWILREFGIHIKYTRGQYDVAKNTNTQRNLNLTQSFSESSIGNELDIPSNRSIPTINKRQDLLPSPKKITILDQDTESNFMINISPKSHKKSLSIFAKNKDLMDSSKSKKEAISEKEFNFKGN